MNFWTFFSKYIVSSEPLRYRLKINGFWGDFYLLIGGIWLILTLYWNGAWAEMTKQEILQLWKKWLTFTVSGSDTNLFVHPKTCWAKTWLQEWQQRDCWRMKQIQLVAEVKTEGYWEMEQRNMIDCQNQSYLHSKILQSL